MSGRTKKTITISLAREELVALDRVCERDSSPARNFCAKRSDFIYRKMQGG
jgi:hypothetical protein